MGATRERISAPAVRGRGTASIDRHIGRQSLTNRVRARIAATDELVRRDPEFTVDVRPWLVTISGVEPQLDLAKVAAEVAKIWGTAKIELRFAKPSVLVIDEEPPESDIRTWFEEHVAKDVNAKIEEGAGKTIDVIFTPSFGPWGRAYTQLVDPKTFEPFVGPVAIITTQFSREGAAPAISRVDQFTGEESIEEYVQLGIVNDAAHEIGHLFGLQHAWTGSDVHLLLNERLYKSVGTVRGPDVKESALKAIAAKAQPFIKHVGKDGTGSWVSLRGVEISDSDKKKAVARLKEGKVWPAENVLK